MQRPSSESVSKAAFIVSLLAVAWLYGFVANEQGWFPSRLLHRAWNQARALTSDPAFVADRVYDRVGARVVRGERMEPGLTLVASVWEDFGWKPGLKLIDRRGRTVHRWPVDPTAIFSESYSGRRDLSDAAERSVHGAHLFRNGDILVNVEYVGTARLDACGNTVWKLMNGNHHSIARADDGSFWIPEFRRETPPTSPDYPDGFPGLDGSFYYHDYLARVSEGGKVRDRISVLDILYGNGLERYLAHTSGGGLSINYRPDLTHVNDIEPLAESVADDYPLFEAGDLLVSLRQLHLVFVVDPDTEQVKWHAHEPFIHQHDPDFTGNGWIGVFDNNQDGTRRGTMLGGSRIVALHPAADSMKIPFPTRHSEPLYTHVQGKWQQLPNGNILLTESGAGRVVEVTSDGRTAWEWFVEPYGESKIPEVTEGTRYPVTAERVASWPCSPGDPEPNDPTE